jgi:hypothetical protein
MGDTSARVFRDKLAMRVLARESHIPVPDFTGVLHYPDIDDFTKRVPPPYMLKPRQEAASAGIKKIGSVEELWQEIHALGDLQSYFLIEKYIPGEVCHVDAIVSEGKVMLMECHKTGIPPFDVSHGGGVFSTSTVERGTEEDRLLRETAHAVLTRFKLLRGTAHVELIKGQRRGGVFPRGGGAGRRRAHRRAGGGVDGDQPVAGVGGHRDRQGAVPYVLPDKREDYAALVQCLAHEERPDLGAYTDPEIVYHTPDRYHAGVIVRSASHARVEALRTSYLPRFAKDFVAVVPLFELPIRRA